MQAYLFQKGSRRRQYVVSIATVVAVAVLGLLLHNIVGYRGVAFMLLVAVSALAMFLDIVPVLLAASLSAVIWNFLFIPPRFTLTVGTTEDRILFGMYFIIAMINGVLTHKIREMEKEMKAKDEKAASLRFYNALLNALSHELRTPITTILGCTDTLQSNSRRLTQADMDNLLSEIAVASMRLNQHVENLLNLSRIESGFFEVKKDWTDVNELIHKALQKLEQHLQNYKVVVYVPEQFPLFKLDFGLMEQVLYNLIINATQHTPEGTIITIQAERDNGHLVITVADNGEGIPEPEFDKVFNNFYSLGESKAGRMGLGLSIVKGFVEAHGGEVRLENLPVCGAKFTIDIPSDISPINKLGDE